MAIDVIKPISKAWNHMVTVCFKPFDIGKWFVLGFAAWVANLGHNGGGGGGSIDLPGGAPGGQSGGGDESFENFVNNVKEFIAEHLGTIILVGSLAMVLILAITVLIIWLQSRMKFVFLDGVVHNRAAIVEPWTRTSAVGNSLFWFQLVLTVISMLVVGAILLVVAAIAWPEVSQGTFGPALIVPAVIGVILLVLFSITMGIIYYCTRDFVVPIMYGTGSSAVAGWKLFLSEIVARHIGPLLLFYLLRIAIGFGIGMGLVSLMCATCFALWCVLIIPYINAVILLPIYVFTRAWSVFMLEEFDERWRLFPVPEPEPVAPMPDNPPTERPE